MHQPRAAEEEGCQQTRDIAYQSSSQCDDAGAPCGSGAYRVVAQAMNRDQVFCMLTALEGEERAATDGRQPHPGLFCETGGKRCIGHQHVQFPQQLRPCTTRAQVIGIGVFPTRGILAQADLPIQSNGRVFNEFHTFCLFYARLRVTRTLPCILCSASGSNPSCTSASSSMTWSTTLRVRSVVASSVSAAGRSMSHTCPLEQRSSISPSTIARRSSERYAACNPTKSTRPPRRTRVKACSGAPGAPLASITTSAPTPPVR